MAASAPLPVVMSGPVVGFWSNSFDTFTDQSGATVQGRTTHFVALGTLAPLPNGEHPVHVIKCDAKAYGLLTKAERDALSSLGEQVSVRVEVRATGRKQQELILLDVPQPATV